MKRFPRSPRDDRGVVSIELVVVGVPILLVLIIATIAVGNFFGLKAQAEGWAREGARTMALGKSLSDVGAPAEWRLTPLVECPPKTSPDYSNSFAEVEVKHDVTLEVPLASEVLDEVIATARFRCGG